MYLVHALIVLCIILKKNDRKGVVCMTNFTVDVSQIVLFIGVMAFIVSIITEALKKWTWFDKKVPTAPDGHHPVPHPLPGLPVGTCGILWGSH